MKDTQGKSSRGLVSIITASSVGTVIEWYDFYIFASLATIIPQSFFQKIILLLLFLPL